MLIGNLPEDTTPSANGYVPYSEDGYHLGKISRDNLLKGAGHGTGMIYWEEGDGQIVNDGTHTNVPRTVIGSLYSYEVEDDGIAYWFAMYPSAYWGSDITTETRHVWELAYEEEGTIHYIAYMDNHGKVFIDNYTSDSVYATQYVYKDDEDNEVNLLDYFMRRFQAGEGIYYDGNYFRGIGATEITINGITYHPDENGNFNLNFSGDFIYSETLGWTTGLSIAGTHAPIGNYVNSDSTFVPMLSLFAQDRYGKSYPLSTAYSQSTKTVADFDIDKLFYYNASTDSDTDEPLESTYVYSSYKKVPINDMYGLSLINGELYLVGTYDSSGWFHLDDNFLAQSIPSTVNNKIYILLGYVVNGLLDFQTVRPKYWYMDGGVRPYSYVPNMQSPISDIYIDSNGYQYSVVGDNNKVGFTGSNTISVNVTQTTGGPTELELAVNTNALKANLPTTIIPNRVGMSGSIGKNNVAAIPAGLFTDSGEYPYCYINLTAVVSRQDSYALNGTKYKAYLTLSSDSNRDPVPYDSGEGGYFIDSKTVISGDTEVVLQLSGLWKTDNYTQSPSNVGPYLILELDTAESLYCDYTVEVTRINLQTSA